MGIKNLLQVLFLMYFVIGCKNPSGNPTQVNADDFLAEEKLDGAKEIYYRFPSPDEMLNFIDKENISFDDQLLLPIEKSKNFLDSRAQALNLGIYIADLAYITVFQRQKESLTYFQVIYGLSDKLRISSALDPNLVIRYENNIKNTDSLKALVDEALNDITNYLVKNEKERVFAVISIGGFVESLYLAFNLCGEYSEDNIIIQRISDQKLVLENLINYTNEFKDDVNVTESVKLIQPIRSLYNELVTSSMETKVTKDPNGKLIISGGEKLIITKDQFEKLRLLTFDIRRNIIENKEN